jgi:hypothetical protein
LLLLVLLPPLLSGCSVAGVNLAFNATPATPVAVPGTAAPAEGTAAAVPTPAFDLQAGNCPDAATQAISFVVDARNKGFNLDMRLDLGPVTALCGASDAALATYRARVTHANLSAWVLDGSWSSFALASRITWLDDMLRRLHGLYPAAIVNVWVYQDQTVLGSAILGTDNRPQVNCCTG